MDTAISTYRRTESVPSHAEPVRLTPSLAYHVAGDTLVDGHYSPVKGRPSPADIREAGIALPRAEHLCRDADPHLIAAWLEKFRGLPKAPVDSDTVKRVVAAMVLANGDLPATVWTAETARRGLQEWHWYPTPADVRALLEPIARTFWRQRDGLKRVLAWSEPATAAPEPKTEQAEQHVASVVSAFVAERSFHAPSGGGDMKAPVKPSPVSDGVLLAAYEAQVAEGGEWAKAAATRAEAIRKRMGPRAHDLLRHPQQETDNA